ncbi:beta-lactamase regulator AmpE [Shewanella sp. 202IG2-18]|uniref:beta-lactamase regulator AmpE n=1 Tax=Parashewanella hymeniacidonis TaxID=2807618 RepID=UPI00196113A0|nr:beta-lactamase regulator AmpE [Parashewanella hymeniacidonis]MBM7073367.1 beta-lactamase regulator AmpE [Parashewanella hymeniacidonis]
MALFSLLIAIFAERLKALPTDWQINQLLSKYHQTFVGQSALSSNTFLVITVVLPSLLVGSLLWFVEGMLWGLVTLVVWVFVATACFSHTKIRQTFKHFIKSALKGDVQACYHLSNELDCKTCNDAISEDDLGHKVGESIAWINYRNYGAIAIYLIAFGPIGAVLYSTIRFYFDLSAKQDRSTPLASTLLFIMDWVPSRIFSFGYLMSGHFSKGFSTWLPIVSRPTSNAKRIISETAVSSEVLPEKSDAPICIQSTLALLTLTKRTFIFLVTLLSLFTIFGWVA